MTDTHPSRSRNDEGSLLVMTMLLVFVFGAVAGAIASYGAASFGHTRVVRTQTAMRISADAGIQLTIDQLKRHQTLCEDFATSPSPLPISPNGASITVNCTGVSGASQGANGWSVILTGVGATTGFESLLSHGGGTRKIGGSVYMAVPASNAVSNLTLSDGDLWYPAADCTSATPPTISGMTITPSPPRGKICTTTTWPSLVPTILLPPASTNVNPSGRDDLVSGCRVFFPGKYTAPPALASQNYFVSGDYYFEFDASWQIKQAVVIGGAIDPTLGDTQYLSAPACNSVHSNLVVANAESGQYGNTWIMGKGATIDVNTQGQLELFRRRQANLSVSLIAVPQGASGGYSPSTVTLPGGTPIIGTKSGSNNDLVIHGLIDAPLAQIGFGNVSGSANAQVLGGVIAAGIDMQSSASASGFVVETSSIPVNAKILIRSKASISTGSATVQAVVDYRPSRLVVDGSVNGTTVSSATAGFTTTDIGNRISGAGIVGDTTIIAIGNGGTTATLSTAATAAGSGLALVIQTPQIAINSWRKL